MARKKTLSDEALLRAALEVFSEQGYQAPVSAVASHAGVSSATVFLRFPTKEALLFAVVSHSFAAELLPLLPTLSAEDDPHAALTRLARTQLGLFRVFAPAMLLGYGAGSKLFMQCLPSENPMSQTIRAVEGFFEQEMAAGRFRQAEPRVIAKAFSSIMAHFAFMEAMGGNCVVPVDETSYINGAIDLVLGGLLPR